MRAYDAVAEDYARLLPDMTLEAPLDRAVLAAFAEMLRQQGDPLVVDVGCGAGRVTKHLDDTGLRVIGSTSHPRWSASLLACTRGCRSRSRRQGRCRSVRAP